MIFRNTREKWCANYSFKGALINLFICHLDVTNSMIYHLWHVMIFSHSSLTMILMVAKIFPGLNVGCLV